MGKPHEGRGAQPGDLPYRGLIKAEGLNRFRIIMGETDLFILTGTTDRVPYHAEEALRRVRRELEEYIKSDPLFGISFVPHPVPEGAPEVVKMMARAASKAGVGPMAAVAGAIAELVGRELLRFSPEVIVENGGDIFLCSSQTRRVGIFAGPSPFSNRIAIEVESAGKPLGVCTSAGTVGHSISFGRADAACVISRDAALADAAATAVGNLVQSEEDIPRAIEFARSVEGVIGAVVIKGKHMGAWGEIEVVPIGI